MGHGRARARARLHAARRALWAGAGPELAFRDVRVRTVGDATPFLTARGASVGFNTIDLRADRLATRRELGVDRLTFDGTELTLVRTEDGRLPLAGCAGRAAVEQPLVAGAARHRRARAQQPRAVSRRRAQRRVGVPGRQPAACAATTELLTVEASALPPPEFANRIEVTAQAFVAADEDRRRAVHRRLAAFGRPRRRGHRGRSSACSRRRPWRRRPAAAT